MARKLLPGQVTSIGSRLKRWAEGHFENLFSGGFPVATLPFSASDINRGELSTSVIKKLPSSALIIPGLPSPPIQISITHFYGAFDDEFTIDYTLNIALIPSDIGKPISGSMIPPGTTITEIFEGTQNLRGRMSANALGAGIAVSFIDRQTIDPPLTLLQVVLAAISGGGDPFGRLNSYTGTGTFNGAKIADASVYPNALRSLAPLTHIVQIGTGGAFQTDNYVTGTTGFSVGKNVIEFNLGDFFGAALHNITISNGGISFLLNALGGASWGDPSVPYRRSGIDQYGRIFAGGPAFTASPFQVDALGNMFLYDGPASLTRIDIGAIDIIIAPVVVTPAGGDFQGNVTMRTTTRRAYIYYTIDGTDPAYSTAPIYYTGPVLIDAPANGTKTLRVRAKKFDTYSIMGTYVFTDPSTPPAGGVTVSLPYCTPDGAVYYPTDGTLEIALASATPGTTIRYTLGTATALPANPTSSTGTIYTGVISRPVGSTVIKAIGIKAGYVNSAIMTEYFTVYQGGGTTPGGGGGGGGVVGGHQLN